MATTRLMTVEEYEALGDDGWRYELIGGVLQRMAPGGLEHGGIGARFVHFLFAYVDAHDLGLVVGADAGFLFERGPDVVRVPDVAFIRSDRLPPLDQWPRVSRVLPDLVVEVISPNDSPTEIAEKVSFYLAHGVPLVWVAYPATRRVAVHRPGEEPRWFGIGDVLDGEEIVPGFRLPLTDIFPQRRPTR